ncbi:hypothetical protein [Agromyces marinus]|uniref:DUF3828 domain-containing protein n=1 Tax=Agromyces marinus TaxID=1389020 RepID=A0ABN6YAM3_9MICO|nr:hypothetical protein [Agromyces marinus]UIP57472.1 hypothetical protein DSM26151_03330 [Agromyces marinus]BDZ54397.1 hypothetical protein GCM10025870_14700 [Agromyces marinus]
MPQRAAIAAIACALLIGTTACAVASAPGGEPRTAPPAETADGSTAEPIFASDEEALAAAVEAYEAYSAMSTLIASEGGVDPERISDVVGKNLAEQFIDEFRLLDEAELRTTGAPHVFGARLADREESSGTASVSAYFCRDVTDTLVLDAQGSDVTPKDRPSISAVIAHFESLPDAAGTLRLDDLETWEDASFCE